MDSDYDFEAAPVLHYDVLSSQARSCCMLIKLLNIDIDLRLTDSLESINFNDSYTWINSFCMLPVLVDGKITLCNGHSILIYLCQKYATSSLQDLCPCDYKKRLKITSVLFYEGCILQRYLTHLLTDIFLGTYCNLNVEYHKCKVAIIYCALNSFLTGQTYLTGNRLTIADISVVSTVSAFNIVFPIDCNNFPNLFEWFKMLKKMPFYISNDEGIQKLSHLLKNIGRFPFPSPLNFEQSENREFDFDEMNNEEQENDFELIQKVKNGNHKNSLDSTDKPNYGKRKSSLGSVDKGNNGKHKNSFESDGKQYRNSFEPVENIVKDERRQTAECEILSETDKMEYNEDLPKISGFYVGNGNDKDKQDDDKIKFFDTYFINVRRCSCCSRIMPKDKMYFTQVDVPKKEELKRESKETEEIFRRPEEHEPSGSSVDTVDRETEYWDRPSPSKNNGNVEDVSLRSSRNEAEEDKRGSSRRSSAKEIESRLGSVEPIDNDRPNTSFSENKVEEYNSKQYEEVTPKHSNEKNVKESDNNDVETVVIEEIKIEKELQNDLVIPNEYLCLTNQKIQDLMNKIQKYEKILEMSDKALLCTNSILATIPSNISSIDKVLVTDEKKLAQKSGPAYCPCCQCCKCWTTEKEEEMKAVEADDEIENKTSLISISSQNEKKENGRLEAGCNRNPYKSQFFEQYFPKASVKFKNTNEDFADDAISHIIDENGEIIYVICSKSKSKNGNECNCDDCNKKETIMNSKIPRLVPSKSLMNDKSYKISNKESLKNFKHVR